MAGDRSDEGTITRWIGDLKSGGDLAAEQLWKRYFDRLVRLARARLMATSRTVADEEDVALSAFHSFLAGVERGRFPNLADRDDLWRLLVVITVRKAIDQHQHFQTARRGGDLPHTGFAADPALLISDEPSPEMAALLAEEYSRLHQALGDDSLRIVLDLRLQGYERNEIAHQLGCSVRSVTRKLALIRDAWVKESVG